METTIKEEFYDDDFKLQVGDIAVGIRETIFVVIKNDEKYQLINMNTWEPVNDFHYTLADLKSCIRTNDMQVYRKSKASVSLGNRIY